MTDISTKVWKTPRASSKINYQFFTCYFLRMKGEYKGLRAHEGEKSEDVYLPQ